MWRIFKKGHGRRVRAFGFEWDSDKSACQLFFYKFYSIPHSGNLWDVFIPYGYLKLFLDCNRYLNGFDRVYFKIFIKVFLQGYLFRIKSRNIGND
jgi:hypothetical protein